MATPCAVTQPLCYGLMRGARVAQSLKDVWWAQEYLSLLFHKLIQIKRRDEDNLQISNETTV